MQFPAVRRPPRGPLRSRRDLNSIPREVLREALEAQPVEVTDLGCHIFLGASGGGGYGTISVHGAQFRTHRVAWVIENGPFPDGLEACHRCGNRRCINPAHIYAGTRRDNVQDCIRMGRFGAKPERLARGEHNGWAKLKDADADYIRASKEMASALARRFSVSCATIYGIRNGTTRKPVTFAGPVPPSR